MKFGCCDTCIHFEDGTACSDCNAADAYEFDETLIDIGDDGRCCIRSERLVAA